MDAGYRWPACGVWVDWVDCVDQMCMAVSSASFPGLVGSRGHVVMNHVVTSVRVSLVTAGTTIAKCRQTIVSPRRACCETCTSHLNHPKQRTYHRFGSVMERL
jgi:hypothetical protein